MARFRCGVVAVLVGCILAVVAEPAVGIASPPRRLMITRTLPFADGVIVSLGHPRRNNRAATLVRFPRNRVALRRTRGGNLALLTSGRNALMLARSRRRARVQLRLDVTASRITAGAGGRCVRLKRALKPERAVMIARTVRRLRLAPIPRRGSTPRSGATPAGDETRPADAASTHANPKEPLTPADPDGPLTSAATATIAPAATTTTAAARLFAPDSVWNQPLPDNAPLDRNNDLLVRRVRNLVAQNIADRVGPRISTTTTTPLYIVPANQPSARVRLDSGSWGATLQQAFTAVPIPNSAVAAAGPDRHLTIWQPSTDRLWEFFHAAKFSDGWHADWGGAIASSSRFPGYYTTDAWPGLSNPYWGATATSLPVIAGTMMISELRAGVIPHALAVNLPQARAKVYAFPAQRTDGLSSDYDAVPEGARFRLDPKLDISKLSLPPVTRAMAVAVQKYGMIVRDQTSTALNFFAENPGQYSTNPYLGPTGLFGGVWSGALLRSFPWDHLQLVRMDLRGQG